MRCVSLFLACSGCSVSAGVCLFYIRQGDYVFLSVCWSVCEQDCLKSLGEEIGRVGPNHWDKKRIAFEGDLDHDIGCFPFLLMCTM